MTDRAGAVDLFTPLQQGIPREVEGRPLSLPHRNAYFATALHVPDTHHLVPSPGEEIAAVMGKLQRPHRSQMSGQNVDQLKLVQIPEMNTAVEASGCHPSPDRIHGDGKNGALVASKAGQFFPGLHVPETHSLVYTGR